MSTFILAFILLLIIMVGMSLGVMLMGKTIKGSCGGLNAISGADKCLVCQKDIDPDSPLRDQLQCKRAKKMLAQMERQDTGAA
ncbi:(Na+)-NQR maturation NqrM [Ruegeria sp.]|uniref:(Na+)-NQR maturation NqrM n=1 Tax=Ruegeria sp. TaxID=1879320 RepID=UPI00230EBA39|nr:(Na+)-NQR maturation NqrM [Ruegeria sp.]MDA7963529.1 (Na+)-NQR maturation NqrM [Ruegeria sp.]